LRSGLACYTRLAQRENNAATPGFVLFYTLYLSVWAMIPLRARSKQDLGISQEVDHE